MTLSSLQGVKNALLTNPCAPARTVYVCVCVCVCVHVHVCVCVLVHVYVCSGGLPLTYAVL